MAMTFLKIKVFCKIGMILNKNETKAETFII